MIVLGWFIIDFLDYVFVCQGCYFR